jgi:ribonuclease D
MKRSTHTEQRHEPHPGAAGVVAEARRLVKLDQKLSREEINRLEIAAYRGPIHVVRSHAQMLAAVRELRRETLLGFDTEKRPSFAKGESHPPALIQLAGREAVYVFQLHVIGLPAELVDLLANPRIVKAGVATGRDLQELRELAQFQPGGFVDIGACAMKSGIKHHGLRGLAALLLGCRISKSAQLTNWERPELPMPALRYAATDAWISRRIYEALKKHGCLDGSPKAPGSKERGAGRPGLWHKAKAAFTRIVRATRGGSRN